MVLGIGYYTYYLKGRYLRRRRENEDEEERKIIRFHKVKDSSYAI